MVGMNAPAAALALTACLAAAPAKALERADVHLGCMAIYALLKMGAPPLGGPAEDRRARAQQAYFRDLPVPSPVPMPLTIGEIEAETRARMQARGAVLADAESNEDVRRETDAFLADIHACDALYGLDPTPTPWRD